MLVLDSQLLQLPNGTSLQDELLAARTGDEALFTAKQKIEKNMQNIHTVVDNGIALLKQIYGDAWQGHTEALSSLRDRAETLQAGFQNNTAIHADAMLVELKDLETASRMAMERMKAEEHRLLVLRTSVLGHVQGLGGELATGYSDEVLRCFSILEEYSLTK